MNIFFKKQMSPRHKAYLIIITLITVSLTNLAHTQKQEPVSSSEFIFGKNPHTTPFLKRFCNSSTENTSQYLIEAAAVGIETIKNTGSFLPEKFPLEWVAPHQKPASKSIQPIITWIGHATVLIQLNGFNIITDPLFGDMPLYPRYMAPGIELKDLPPIDIILLSHNHRDHCDIQTLKELVKNQPLCLVGKGLKTTFTNIGFKNVQEKTWWEKETAKKDTASLTITFLPAWHWSNTGLTDVNKSLWGSWMIENGTTTIYFGGDSASEKHFSLIAENFPKIDVALLPIGPVSPREFTKRSHMDGIEAIKAFIDLKARIFIPIHWGTFRLGPDGFYDPIYLLQSEWQKHIDTTLKNKELKALQLGGICTL